MSPAIVLASRRPSIFGCHRTWQAILSGADIVPGCLVKACKSLPSTNDSRRTVEGDVTHQSETEVLCRSCRECNTEYACGNGRWLADARGVCCGRRFSTAGTASIRSKAAKLASDDAAAVFGRHATTRIYY